MKDEVFLRIAKEISEASKCISKKVGAVIVKDGRIVSSGYNGTPPGYINCSDAWCDMDTDKHHEWSLDYEIHAEMNAIIWAARKGISIEGAYIYSTHEPCGQCTKNIIASGIKKIFFTNDYKHTDSERVKLFLDSCGVEKHKVYID